MEMLWVVLRKGERCEGGGGGRGEWWPWLDGRGICRQISIAHHHHVYGIIACLLVVYGFERLIGTLWSFGCMNCMTFKNQSGARQGLY